MKSRYTIGKNPDNDIVLSSPVISRYHADLMVSDQGWRVQFILMDHSTNGTYVNGQILRNASCYVAYGDSIFFAGQVPLDWGVFNSMSDDQGNTRICYLPYAEPESSRQIDRGVTFVGALKSFFSKYADFSGRASRSEFWFMYLWLIIFGLFLDIIGIIAAAVSGLSLLVFDPELLVGSMTWYLVMLAVYGLALFLPSLALMIRRIHDTGHSGVWILMSLVPLANIVFFFIWTLTPSCPSPNKWGV